MGCEVVKKSVETVHANSLPIGTVCVIDDKDCPVYRGTICVKCSDGALQAIGGITFWSSPGEIRVRVLPPGTLLRIT